uniref:Uncharacterized protein n=1 Tax=Rhizophora mucronata TaxID=61149 RepID=A0A2P2IHS2_RHIMU
MVEQKKKKQKQTFTCRSSHINTPDGDLVGSEFDSAIDVPLVKKLSLCVECL